MVNRTSQTLIVSFTVLEHPWHNKKLSAEPEMPGWLAALDDVFSPLVARADEPAGQLPAR